MSSVRANQLGALGLVVNVVVLWNTLYMDAALAHLRRQSVETKPEDVVRLSPWGTRTSTSWEVFVRVVGFHRPRRVATAARSTGERRCGWAERGLTRLSVPMIVGPRKGQCRADELNGSGQRWGRQSGGEGVRLNLQRRSHRRETHVHISGQA